MSYSEIVNVVLPTFLAILIGYALGKTVRIDMTGLIDVVFYIGLPCIAFVSILSQDIVLLDAVKVWASTLMVTSGCGVIGFLLFKLIKKKHSGLYLPMSWPNSVNIPFPIITLAYGPAGLFAATLYYIPNVILMYSIGVFIAAGKSWRENLKEMLKVPTVYAAILALLLNLGHLSVPSLVIKPLDFISGMVIPAVVLTLGYNLSKVKITSLPTTLLASLVRVGGGMAIGFTGRW
jgi:predicted permease